jgi:hypothetical protein
MRAFRQPSTCLHIGDLVGSSGDLVANPDGFLQTGLDSSGIEKPSSRRVRASVDEAPIMTVSADEAPVVIFDEIYESWRRNQPRPLLNGDGTMAIGVNQPRWEN